jgi:hypothetical protein
LTSPLAGLRPGARRRGRGSVLLIRRPDQVKTESKFVASHGVLHVPQRTGRRPRRTGRRPRRWTPGGTPARRDFNRQPFSGAPARRDFQSPALQRTGAASTKVDARRHAPTARCQSPALQRHARAARFSIASPSADGAASTKVDARRHAPTARCQSPALQRHARAARFPIASLSPHPGGRGDVHEGGRPAARPRGAISNRQPFSGREQRPRRWTPGGTPARRDVNRQPFSGTPARRDFQSPALQRTEQRPRRWTPGGTPPRRDVNRQPFSGTPARRDFQSLASHLTPADGATSTKVDARRHARAARFPIASPSADGAASTKVDARRHAPRRDFQSPALQRTGAASTKVDARRHAPTARCQSPALQRHARAARFSIASPSADGAASTKVDARRHAPTARCQSPALQRHARAARFPIASLSPHPGGRGDVHEGGRPAARPRGAISNRQPLLHASCWSGGGMKRSKVALTHRDTPHQ